VVNAATGNNVQLNATGGDTNIGITFTPKGSKDISVAGGLLAADFGNGSGQLSYGFTSSPTSGIWWQTSGGANGTIHLRNNGTDYLSVAAGMVTISTIPKFAGTNTTGAGSAALGSNSPAVTNSAPYTWIQAQAADGSTVYIPAWK
jgi:hypothetical protein